MDVAHSVLCKPVAERHPTGERSRFRGRAKSHFVWEMPFQSLFTVWISEGNPQLSRLRLESRARIGRIDAHCSDVDRR